MLLCANLLQPCSPWSWWSQPEPPPVLPCPGRFWVAAARQKMKNPPPKNTWGQSVPLSSPPCEPLLALRTPKHFFFFPFSFFFFPPLRSPRQLFPRSLGQEEIFWSWLFGARGMGFAPPGALTAWGEVKHTSPHKVKKKKNQESVGFSREMHETHPLRHR